MWEAYRRRVEEGASRSCGRNSCVAGQLRLDNPRVEQAHTSSVFPLTALVDLDTQAMLADRPFSLHIIRLGNLSQGWPRRPTEHRSKTRTHE